MKWIVAAIILISASLLGLFVAGQADENQRLDRCLDGGGCWDYGARTCRKEEPNAQALCDASTD